MSSIKLDEINVINFLAKNFSVPPSVVGIGDDCAVIPLNDDENLLITVDALVEGVHFTSSLSPKDLGYKSVMVTVSDIASMGGTPEYLFLVYALPTKTSSSWLHSFVTGFKQACKETNTFLLGGDTVKSRDSIFLSVTAVGKAKKNYTKYRSQAKVGDIICVTGQLGESPTGLKCILNNLPLNTEINQLIKAHIRPKAHIKQGLWLGQHPEVHAMEDISDGIDRDLSNILRASNVGAIINIEQLPISDLAKKTCLNQVWDYESLALSGGEEYCLLLTVATDTYQKLNEEFKKCFRSPLYSIGQIMEQPALRYLKNGRPININLQTYDHFKEEKND